MASEESTPLLDRQAAAQNGSFSAKSIEERFDWKKRWADQWPVLRILIAFSLWSLAIFGPLAARIDKLRSLVCADFYFQNGTPQANIHLSQHLCAVPEVEAKVSTFNLVIDLTHGAAAALGLLLYSSMISKGRKRVFSIGTIAGIFHLAPYVFLPLGYPFAPSEKEMIITPRTSLYLVYGFSLLSGLLAFEDLSPLVSKALIADISSPQLRMRNLTWLMIAMLISVSLGPVIFSGIILYLPPISPSTLIYHFGFQVDTQTDLNSQENILPFLVGIFLQILSLIWMISFVPETAGLRDPEAVSSSVQPTAHGWLSVLSILLPKEIPSEDQDSPNPAKKDWRITRLTLVGQAGIAGAMGLQALILFCGYALQWSPDQVGILISWMGSVRALVLILLVPLTLTWLSRVVKKPKDLSELGPEEMERISKNPQEVEAIIENEEEVEQDIAQSTGMEREPEAVEREARELTEMRENLERDEELRKQLSIWKAKVDLLLLKCSFFLDMIGWIITFLGAQTLSALPLYIGGVFVSFGVAANGAMVSIGIAIVTDMHHRGFQVGKTSQEATDRLLGAITFCEAIGRCWSPIVSTIIYRASLSSFPGASFLYSSLMYGVALGLLLGVRVEKG